MMAKKQSSVGGEQEHIKTTSSQPQVLVYRQGEQPRLAEVDHRRSLYSQDKAWSPNAQEGEGKRLGIDDLTERMAALEKKLEVLVDILRETET